MAGVLPIDETNEVIWRSFSTWSSDQMPRSFGVMRPSGETAVASDITMPAPPTARLPRWTRCQSSANPSVEEYWHIGETMIRFGTSVSRSESGVKSVSVIDPDWAGAGKPPSVPVMQSGFGSSTATQRPTALSRRRPPVGPAGRRGAKGNALFTVERSFGI